MLFHHVRELLSRTAPSHAPPIDSSKGGFAACDVRTETSSAQRTRRPRGWLASGPACEPKLPYKSLTVDLSLASLSSSSSWTVVESP